MIIICECDIHMVGSDMISSYVSCMEFGTTVHSNGTFGDHWLFGVAAKLSIKLSMLPFTSSYAKSA